MHNGSEKPSENKQNLDTKVEKSTKKSNQIWKKVIISFTAVIVVVGLLIGGMFINVGAQTIGGQILDGMGLHSQAFAIDKISKSDSKNVLAYFAQIDPRNPDKCGSQSILITNYLSELNKVSGISSSTFEILNPDYNDVLSFNGSIEGMVDFQNAQIQGNWDVAMKTDIDTIQQIAQEMWPDQKLNKTNIGKLELISQAFSKIDVNSLNLKLDKLLLTQAEGKIDLSSSKWYTQKSELKDSQITAAKEITQEIAKTAADFRFEKAFENETLSKYLVATCKVIDKVEMLSPQTKTFGTGNFARTNKVRPVKITLKADADKIMEKELNNFGEVLAKDAKLKSYLYSLYPTARSIAEKAEKVVGTENTDPNKYPQKEYEESIDKFLEELGRPADKENTTSPSPTTNFENALKGIKSTQSTTYYLDLQTLGIYGVENTTEATFTDSFYTEIYKDTQGKSPTLEKMLSKGIKSSQQLYNLQYNDKAISAVEVKDAGSFSDLEKDVLSQEEIDFASKLSEKFINIFYTQNEADAFDTALSDEMLIQEPGLEQPFPSVISQ